MCIRDRSQIASFYLIKNNQRQELSDGNCSGAVYMAIWDWCECELDLDVRFPAPQTEDTLDCALLEGELASKVLAALREHNLPQLAAKIAPDWDLQMCIRDSKKACWTSHSRPRCESSSC